MSKINVRFQKIQEDMRKYDPFYMQDVLNNKIQLESPKYVFIDCECFIVKQNDDKSLDIMTEYPILLSAGNGPTGTSSFYRLCSDGFVKYFYTSNKENPTTEKSLDEIIQVYKIQKTLISKGFVKAEEWSKNIPQWTIIKDI